MPLVSRAIPTFVVGSPETITVCQNSGTTDISSHLAINDVNGAATETWNVAVFPSGGGNLSGFPYANPSTGGLLTPSGLVYTPLFGFSGIESFTVMVDDGAGDTIYKVVNVFVSALPSLVIGSIPAVCANAVPTTTTLSYTSLANVGAATSSFPYTGNFQTWIVPSGVTSVHFDVQGAVGGNDNHSGAPNPGLGGRVQGDLAVTGGEVLNIYSGGAGGNGTSGGAAGGFNGGGNAFFYFFGCGGAGGGASDIRANGNALTNRVVVAGGGGGNGWDSPGPDFGGDGAFPIGGSSANNVGGSHSGGGTQSGGGAAATYLGWNPGTNGSLGIGGDGSMQGISGGGGGGWYGGGGGVWTGGGGGSSHVGAGVTSPVYTNGYNIGNGSVVLDYIIPGTYDIVWDGFALGQGFTNVTGASLPLSPIITINVPGGAMPTTYNGSLRITNMSNGCSSDYMPFQVVVNPIPDVASVANQDLCNGSMTSAVFFSGSVSGTTFSWTNDNPAIGLPSNGIGNIPAFTAVNAGTGPVSANITVTPTANGCTGTPIMFTINVKPTPTLNTPLTAAPICDSTLFSYMPASATTGTTFIWFRNTVSGVTSLAPSSGSDNPLDYLDNTTVNPVTQTYTYTLAANGCVNNQTVSVIVNPKPVLSSTLTPLPICNNNTLNYTPLSGTFGTTFTWNRNLVAGISNLSATGTNNPSSSPSTETLNNTTTAPVAVPYIYTLVANGCVNMQTVTVTVNPTPMLTSSVTPPAICDSGLFSYTPTSATTGTTFGWNRAFISGISNGAASGTNDPAEYLENTTANPINVVYTYTLMANGCSHNQNVVVTVNPKPMLSSSVNTSVCDSSTFNYVPASLTAGTTFTWTRDTVHGISNPIGSGTGNINEVLLNTTPNPIVVTYVYTLQANGCSNTQRVSVTVNPKPVLISTLTPPAICDSFLFSYDPKSSTAGATFSWYRPYIPGIYAVASSGTGNPNQKLINSTYVVVDVVYTYTITANGCSNVEEVTVPVNPTPKLNPPYTATVCSGSPFMYTPTSYTPGAGFAWNRPQVANIGAPTSFGVGAINETLYDSILTPVYVDYVFRLSINGCINLYTQNVKVKVNPTPPVPQIIIHPDENINLCSGTLNQNFGANMPLPTVLYTWSADNAYIWSYGTNNQNVLVNFSNPGPATVKITSNVNGYGCTSSSELHFNVSSSVADVPEVVYYNGQFICLRNDNGSYQWGYDDANTLVSTELTGQIDQSYTNLNPDFTANRYWCITKNGDCWQKSYYNAPSGVTSLSGDAEVSVYPNPTKETVNVEVKTQVSGDMQVEVLNMLGQRVAEQNMVNHKASVNVSSLPAGAYLVDCYRDGVKIATSRFIKN